MPRSSAASPAQAHRGRSEIAGGRPPTSPARIAAVLWIDGELLFTDCEPPSAIVDAFYSREDKQIMGLELLSIALGLSTFQEECKGRRVVVYSDNKGAEGAVGRATAKAFDHCCLVNAMWTHALLNHMFLWIERVDTHDNLADLPSRQSYCALNGVNAGFRAPRLSDLYVSISAWERLWTHV